MIVNRPFAQSALFARCAARRLPDWAAELECTSFAQLFLKYVLSHPAVTCVIPATRDPAHLRDNLQAAAGPLPDRSQRAAASPSTSTGSERGTAVTPAKS